MFNFEEKQGRLVLRVDCFLELDLDNKELEKVFNELTISINHPLISDIDLLPVTE
jgi:hypothetical protein